MHRARSISVTLLVIAASFGGAVKHELAASAERAEAGKPTIAQLLSAPFPSGLTAAPAGRRLAWIFNASGVRNVWVADGPALAARQLTTFEHDDGTELTSLTWTPDGSRLLFVRGQGPNRQGEHPNPTHDPEGADQTIWTVAVAGGAAKKIGSGRAPAVRPDGARFAYLQQREIWHAAVDETGEPERLASVRGNPTDLRWSPDATRLAFTSQRGTHSFIGVLDVGARTIRYLDPSLDRDSNPVWSPDGEEIVFLRQPPVAEGFLFRPAREGEPWLIRRVNVRTGAAREIWRAERGRGSAFRAIVGDSQVLWTSDDFIVFPWEREGWTHLYSVPAAGGTARLLTPGAFEVEDVGLGPDKRTILFNSNQDDIDRRHIWEVAPGANASPRALTSGRAIEWSPVRTADGSVLAYLRSDARTPAHPVVQVGGEARSLAPGTLPGGFPVDDVVEPEAVMVTAADGLQIPAQLFKPRRAASGERHPAVIFLHGGSRRQMLLGWHYGAYYHNAYALNQYLASRGFIVLSLNYRSGTGYGLEFREALNYGAAGASEFNDVLGAGLYLRSRADVDARRIGLWGGSYGGYLTALGLAQASDLFAAGVDVHGVHDWNVTIRNFRPEYNPLAHPEVARVAFESSPMAHLDSWRSPVLLIHGDDDRNVPFSESLTLVEALRTRKVPHEVLVFPDEVHSFLRHASWVGAFEAAADFLERHLAQGGRPTSQ